MEPNTPVYPGCTWFSFALETMGRCRVPAVVRREEVSSLIYSIRGSEPGSA